MKPAKVSALRERGLHRACGAEPPCLVINANKERKADTMNTYLLRHVSKVQPQPPSAPASAVSGPVLYIGLDVHSDSIAVSLAPCDSTEVRRYGLIGGAHDDVLRLAKKLQAAHRQVQLRFCYEAGPHGYPLCRFLGTHGYHC